MREEIMVAIDLEDGVKKFGDIEERLDVVRSTLAEIGEDLQDTAGWEGDANRECQAINALLQQYLAEIEPFVEETKQALRSLVDNAQVFESDSACVARIKKW